MASIATAPWRVYALFLLVLVGCGCGNAGQGSSGQPVNLMLGIKSRQSPAEIREWLGDRASSLRVIESSDLPEGDERPRFSILKWSVGTFDYQGVVGELQISFFNDQLMSVWFFPADPEALSKIAGEAATTGDGAKERDGLRVRIDRDYRGKRYVAYEDSSLVEAMEEWLSKYS